MSDAQKMHDRVPEVGFELSAAVGGDTAWQSEPCDPPLHQRLCAGFRRNVGQRNSFRPTGVAVDTGEQVSRTLGRGQRANKVYVDSVETAIGKLEPL